MLLRGASGVITAEELRKKLGLGRPLRIKLGVDPTTRDLHVGHTVCLKKMRAFQEAGHIGVLIIGDFTARIGDPSGRTQVRAPLSVEQVQENAATYKEQALQILNPAKTELRFNSEWLDPFLSSGKFLEYLPRVTHARLTEREDFKTRISEGKPITMLEIMYPVFQGYDSVAVRADVELGGTDQTFNLLFGRDMQRDYEQEPQVVMTLPLLTGTDGARKMSKTYDNVVALKDAPEEMFGKIMSINDEAMMIWAELLTDLDLAKLRAMHPMKAKALLAETLAAQFHGQEAGRLAQERFFSIHSDGQIPEDMPEFRLPKDKKLFLSQVLHLAGLASSRKEAQRKITEGGVRLDGSVVKEDKIFNLSIPIVLTLGKRNFCRVIS